YTLWEYDDERAVERIIPTAFDAVIRAGVDCAGLLNHDPNMLLGRTSAGTMTLEKTDAGLSYAIQLPDSPVGTNVAESIKRGDLRGSSCSFRCSREGQRWVMQGKLSVREIHSVEALYDVGPVVFPAYAATTAGMRGRLLQRLDECDESDECRRAYMEWKAWLR